MVAIYRCDHDAVSVSALVRAFEPVAAELRLVDAADYIAYIHQKKFANIHDIVNSSVELFFQPETLIFGWGAEYELDWNSAPVVKLDMESSPLGAACLQACFGCDANQYDRRLSIAR
jgi:hypothetical protein